MTRYIDPQNGNTSGVSRRTVLRSVTAVSAASVVGLPAFAGTALAEEHDPAIEVCGLLDIYCAIDTSGSLSSSERDDLEDGVNGFIDALPIDGSVQVGTLEFGNNGVRNQNALQNPDGLSVTVSSPGGNTPMPAAMDIADQALYGDANARTDALKLLVVFTDGGPNYTAKQYSLNGYVAPRDDTTDWSAASGDTPAAYDEEGTAATGYDGRQVTVGEMDETAIVAASIKDGGIGDGATMIATVYVGADGEDNQAMGTDAATKYTDLPTYLESEIASSSDFAIDVDIANVEGLVDQLTDILDELCCTPCPADFYYKFEWVEEEACEDGCTGEFVVYDADDRMVESVEGLELVSVTCDEDGEPQQACFETTLCGLNYTVKAGRGTETGSVTYEGSDGAFCVTGITTTNPKGKEVTHAISHVVFTCPDGGSE